jgi:catechol 2,3-dioxygenase-like lactoylglutathione lyase family enzyme
VDASARVAGPAAIPNAQLTHLGIFVHDPDAMVAFYTSVFGMVVSDQGEFRGKQLTFLTGSSTEHHQVVFVHGRTAPPDTRLLSQISFRVGALDDLRTFAALALANGAAEIDARNHGNSWSIYFRDPEHNMIEMYVATPWQVRQPWRIPLDLSMDDEAILAATEHVIADHGVGVDLATWETQTDERLRAHRSMDAGGAR